MIVDKASLVIRTDGKTYACDLSTVNLTLMFDLIATLTDKGKIKAFKLDEDYEWKTFGDIRKEAING